MITHDDQFVQLLGTNFAEYVWKVKKDGNYSKIMKESINRIL